MNPRTQLVYAGAPADRHPRGPKVSSPRSGTPQFDGQNHGTGKSAGDQAQHASLARTLLVGRQPLGEGDEEGEEGEAEGARSEE